MKKKWIFNFLVTGGIALIFCLSAVLSALFTDTVNHDILEEKQNLEQNNGVGVTEILDEDVQDEIGVIFNPDEEEMFVFENVASKQQLENVIKLRSEFSTSLVGSDPNRKHNVETAIKCFNGMIVLPDEVISFNQTTGERTNNSDYKDAKIIVQGEFVLGTGGGVCQASTTLYNALIRSDVEILTVNNHTLPVGYVPRAFDAMVNDSTSDLIFKNNTGYPLYFLTGVKEDRAFVKIFGAPLEEGLTIETRSEFIKDLPHKGDKILPDTKGTYSDKITYKGEYWRVRYPSNGSEYKGYLQYIKNGEVIAEKEVRHVYYSGQEGIIMEGTEELFEGMTLPDNNVEFINPQI